MVMAAEGGGAQPVNPPSGGCGESKVKNLVVDSGALIKGSGYRLAALAEQFWTTADVLAEIRDPKSRFHLETLPFELRTREPTEKALKAVIDFSRKTGDFAMLSKVDLRVLALTYTIEAEEKGGVAHLRTEVAAKPGATVLGGKASAPRLIEGVGSAATSHDDRAAERTGGTPEGLQQGDNPADDDDAGVVVEEVVDENEDDGESGSWTGSEREDGSGDEEDDGEDEEVSGPEGPEQELGGGHDLVTGEGLTPSTSMDGDTVAAHAAGPDVSRPSAASAAASPASARGPISWADRVKAAAAQPPAKPDPAKAAQEAAKQPPAIPVVVHQMEKLELGGSAAASAGEGKKVARTGEVTSRLLGASGASSAMEGSTQAAREDDGEGWIHVGNIKEARAKGHGFFGHSGACKGVRVEDQDGRVPVACVTTDFSMQNVLLQMGLRLVSVEGVAVRRVKQWARRCESCSKIVHDQDRMFCPRCGNPYLTRVAISVDSETGRVTVYLRKNYRPRTRGCKYPLPKPGHAGRFEGELLLREDQLMMGIWAQKMKRKQKAVDSMFGSDITADLGMSVRKPVDDIQVGYGRKNPNAQRGRERRGKKKTKGSK